MARVAARQPPAWSAEGQQVTKEVKELGRELETVRSAIPDQRIVVGSIVLFSANQTLGAGWRQCAGDEISRFDYGEIFAALGETHGAGDGSSTINLPDLVAAAPALTAYWIYVGGE